MARTQLDSDRVNYLIWRYLLESDYRETAARLQKEWNIQDPQQLPFADRVDNHALVCVLNRGLLYDGEEREVLNELDDAAQVPSGLFGPLMPSSAPAPDEEIENVKKRPMEPEQPQLQSGPPGKKQRLVNGYENGYDATAMDVDDEQNGDENAYPSPEQLPSPIVATNGPEQGTQVDKVNDLSTEEVFLELSDEPSSKNTVVLQCEFSPRDPTILAAAGTDALARMWTINRVKSDTPSDSPGRPKPVFAPRSNLLDDNALPNTTVTCLSWASDGLCIAVASEPAEGTAKIEFWSAEGASLCSFSGLDSPVICMRWNPANTGCLALSPQDESGSLVSVMCPSDGKWAKFSLQGHTLHDQLLDAAWISNEEFVIGGGNILQSFHYDSSSNSIAEGKSLETRAGDNLTRITFDWHSNLLATASESGMIDVWDLLGSRRSFNAHQGQLTALAWQPLKAPQDASDNLERLLVSAGEDGAICIWDARSPDGKPKCQMTMNSAVMALSFTPDGAFLAGGTTQQVLIWKVDEPTVPRASWTRGHEAGWETPRSHDSTGEEDQFSLSWDANGQMLAYGVNSRLAVISFRP